MADVVRDVEFFDLHGHQRRADLGKRSIVVGAYLDTGAGRTIVSTHIADSIRMIDVPSYRIQYTVPINQVASTRMTAMRLRVPGCAKRPPIPMLVAVSDEIIGKLELPGVEVLVGQDYMQAARMRMDLAPGREKQEVSCRPPPRGYAKVHYGEAVRLTRTMTNRLRALSRGPVETVKRGHYDPLVERGLASRGLIPKEYGPDLWRFEITDAGRSSLKG